MKQILDINSWNRKEHFQFFKTFDDPFFGLTVLVDFTLVYKEAKQNGASFFLYSLHKIMTAANAIDNFRYRMGMERYATILFTLELPSDAKMEHSVFVFGNIMLIVIYLCKMPNRQ